MLGAQAGLAAVVGPQHERTAGHVDGLDRGPLGGDQAAVRAGGQGDDAVAGPVGGPAGAGELRAGEPSRGLHPGPGAAVELGHVGPPPGVQARLMAGRHVGRPGVDGGLQGVVPGGDGVDAALLAYQETASATSPSRNASRAWRSPGSCWRRFSLR